MSEKTNVEKPSIGQDNDETLSAEVEPQQKQTNLTLEREQQGCSHLLFYMVIFLFLDVWKQVTSYGMRYYNNNRYPVPQTQVVAVTESIKFIVFLGILIITNEMRKVKFSIWYIVPSLAYAINNNIYYFALNFVSPPTWNIVSQLRLLFIALTYRFMFKREITKLQWLALTLIIGSIVMMNMSGDNKTEEKSNNFTIALILATIGAVISVFGTITMEYLFKNDKKPFAEMQMQLYLFSAGIAWIFCAFEVYSSKKFTIDEKSNRNMVLLMVAGCITFSSTSGISVAYIIKKLDNIVKIYSQALSNILTSIACFVLFPESFQLNLTYVMCLILMFVAIFLYELKNIDIGELVSKHYTRIVTTCQDIKDFASTICGQKR